MVGQELSLYAGERSLRTAQAHCSTIVPRGSFRQLRLVRSLAGGAFKCPPKGNPRDTGPARRLGLGMAFGVQAQGFLSCSRYTAAHVRWRSNPPHTLEAAQHIDFLLQLYDFLPQRLDLVCQLVRLLFLNGQCAIQCFDLLALASVFTRYRLQVGG